MTHILFTLGAVALCLALLGCQNDPRPVTTTANPPPVPQRAEDVQPLTSGQAPNVQVRRLNGQAVEMSDLYRQKPTVLVFYRGGWCPYCNVQLGHLAEAEAGLLEMGYQVMAISPDRPEAMRDSVEKGQYRYELLSDSSMSLARAFGVAFRVDDTTVDRYRGFGIDLEQASGENHHLLPVPAVYIIDTDGMIRFAHWDADYRERLEPDQLLAQARAAHRQ